MQNTDSNQKFNQLQIGETALQIYRAKKGMKHITYHVYDGIYSDYERRRVYPILKVVRNRFSSKKAFTIYNSDDTPLYECFKKGLKYLVVQEARSPFTKLVVSRFGLDPETWDKTQSIVFRQTDVSKHEHKELDILAYFDAIFDNVHRFPQEFYATQTEELGEDDDDGQRISVKNFRTLGDELVLIRKSDTLFDSRCNAPFTPMIALCATLCRICY